MALEGFLMGVGTFGLVAASVSFVVFILFYWRMTDWRNWEMGRHLMAFMIVLGTILLYALIANLIDMPLWIRLIARLLSFWSVAYLGAWRVYLLFKTQRAGIAGRLPGPKHRE